MTTVHPERDVDMLADHAVGIELQIIDLVAARRDGADEIAGGPDAVDMVRLYDELATTAALVCEAVIEADQPAREPTAPAI
jgi:hypothetical protein